MKKELIETKQTKLLDFNLLAEEIKTLTKEIIKNQWEIAKRLKYINKNWKNYKKNIDFPYTKFEDFIQDYYNWTKQEAYVYIDARTCKELIEAKSKAGFTFPGIGITVADRLYDLYKLDEERAIYVIKNNPDITRREIDEIIKQLYEQDNSFSPKIYDVWNFSDCDDRFGIEYPGRIPGQLVMNCLYYYTEEGDIVVDFMAGGGTTHDVCIFMDRKCYSFDVKPSRDFIIEHNLVNGNKDIQLPELEKNPNLIFADPPYWTMKKEKYNGGFSNVSLGVFYNRIEKFASECYKILDKKGIFAFLIQNQTGRDVCDKEAILHTYNCSKIFEKIGFNFIRIINCPQGTQQDQPQEVIKAKEEQRMLGIVRDLLIFRK